MPTVGIDKHIIDGLRKLHIFHDDLHSFINYAASKEIRVRLNNIGEDSNEKEFDYYYDNNKHICPICKQICSTAGGLTTHIRRMHIEPNKEQEKQKGKIRIKCPYCGVKCNGMHGLDVHIGYKHPETKDDEEVILKVYFCSYCSRTHNYSSIIGKEHLIYKEEKSENFIRDLYSGKLKRNKNV